MNQPNFQKKLKMINFQLSSKFLNSAEHKLNYSTRKMKNNDQNHFTTISNDPNFYLNDESLQSVPDISPLIFSKFQNKRDPMPPDFKPQDLQISKHKVESIAHHQATSPSLLEIAQPTQLKGNLNQVISISGKSEIEFLKYPNSIPLPSNDLTNLASVEACCYAGADDVCTYDYGDKEALSTASFIEQIDNPEKTLRPLRYDHITLPNSN